MLMAALIPNGRVLKDEHFDCCANALRKNLPVFSIFHIDGEKTNKRTNERKAHTNTYPQMTNNNPLHTIKFYYQSLHET